MTLRNFFQKHNFRIDEEQSGTACVFARGELLAEYDRNAWIPRRCIMLYTRDVTRCVTLREALVQIPELVREIAMRLHRERVIGFEEMLREFDWAFDVEEIDDDCLMSAADFEKLFFVEQLLIEDGTRAYLVINGRDCIKFKVTVEYGAYDYLSFNDPDYDGDSGVYEMGYGVTINDGSDDAKECAFRTLEECVDFVNYETLPMEGYVI